MTPTPSAGEPFISVLLPVRNETDEFRACLESVAAQDYPPGRLEVIVADAGDEERDRGPLPPGLAIRVLPNPDRLMSRGLNLAAGHARGVYLAVVSAHSVLPAGYLRSISRIAEQTGADNVGGYVQKVGVGRWGRAIAAATSSPFAVGNATQHHGSGAGLADSAFPGFIRRSMFDRVGGFDVRLGCNEDDAFNARLREIGGRVWYDPTIAVVYRPRESLTGAFRQHFRYGRWKVAVARTGVRGYIRWRHIVPSVTVMGAIVLPLSSLLVPSLALGLGCLGIAYMTAAAVEAGRMARRHGAAAWRTFLVFPVIHAGYGLGFLRGLLDRGFPVESETRLQPRLSRRRGSGRRRG